MDDFVSDYKALDEALLDLEKMVLDGTYIMGHACDIKTKEIHLPDSFAE